MARYKRVRKSESAVVKVESARIIPIIPSDKQIPDLIELIGNVKDFPKMEYA